MHAGTLTLILPLPLHLQGCSTPACVPPACFSYCSPCSVTSLLSYILFIFTNYVSILTKFLLSDLYLHRVSVSSNATVTSILYVSLTCILHHVCPLSLYFYLYSFKVLKTSNMHYPNACLQVCPIQIMSSPMSSCSFVLLFFTSFHVCSLTRVASHSQPCPSAAPLASPTSSCRSSVVSRDRPGYGSGESRGTLPLFLPPRETKLDSLLRPVSSTRSADGSVPCPSATQTVPPACLW